MKLTTEQFAVQFNDRLRMLWRSTLAYDEGDYAEATRIAGSVVKLIGDRTRKSGEVNKNFISLATRLGIKPEQMIDSSLDDIMEDKTLHGPLCSMGFNVCGASGMVPILDGFQEFCTDPLRTKSFEEWWNSPVIRDCRGGLFSRRLIVETMRDQEDAHTDGDLDSTYAEVAYKGAIGIKAVNHEPAEFDLNPARVVVRQIAHEVLRTFCPDFPRIYIKTNGLKVQPVILFEFMEQGVSGEMEIIENSIKIEFRNEFTSTSEVWREWESSSEMWTQATFSGGRKAYDAEKGMAMRAVVVNCAPYPIESVKILMKSYDDVGQV